MREDNVFILSVCVGVCMCVCVCLSVCVSLWAITFECLDIQKFHFWYGGTRSSLGIKVTLVKLASWTVGHQICLP